MNLSAPFIARPVATTLLTIGIALAGIFAYFKLPVSPLPQVDFPTISVQAMLPGASPETVATSVASPLERHLGQIADVTEMTSTSSVGQARVVLQFGLDRDINGAARDVQAAINAARADLPTSLRSNPTYRKVNPADAPVLILALTSKTLTRGQMYDAATNVLQQRLSQITGIGQVTIGGAALPAVRVELNPQALFKYGIGLEDVRAALASANANSPKGAIEPGGLHYQLYTNDQASHADDYKPLVVAYRNGAAVRLSDLADVQDSVENLRNAGLANGKPAVLVILFLEPGANIIQTVDSVKSALPQLMAAMPADLDLTIASDRTTTIRSSLHDTERTLLISVGLVILVVFLYLRNFRVTLIPAVAVPVSIIGTFGAMYLLGYSLDNLSLMALTVATGFVVDDAIVVLENISRHIEDGMPRLQAALRGAREVGFTVISISLSLIAVFLPILLMGGIVGRLFREFAVTLSLAILVSLAISLTTTPMMCALLLRPAAKREGPARRTLFDRAQAQYGRTLAWALRHSALVMLVLLATVALNVVLYVIIPKGFFPEEDTGRMTGGLQADQSISFQAMQQKLTQLMTIVQQDPAIENVVGFTGAGGGGGQTNTGQTFVALKSRDKRAPIDAIIARLRSKLAVVPGARLFLQPNQDIRVGGRQSNAAYQYTLQADSADALYLWTPKLVTALEHNKALQDVNSDQQQNGLETDLAIDRPTASRLGITASQIDNTLYDAFGQRQVSTIYSAQNQYHVVMEVDPRYWQSPDTLKDIYVSTSGGNASGTETSGAVIGTVGAASATAAGNSAASISGSSARNAATNALANTGKGSASAGAAVSTSKETMVPLSAFSSYAAGKTPLGINHQGLFVAATISFNLAPGKSLSDATAAVDQAARQIGMPASIRGSFQGTAQTYQASLDSEPILIATALAAVYIVLGVLYESYIHPITILSTLPSAGIGAVLALLLFGTEFSIIALIGVILLIGIVKKNAIMMIDFALEAERERGLVPVQAIFQACMMRFRPIMMTTSAAMLGALPLALSFGDGGELRRPLGIAIVGGLMVSQVLTLYTTPVLYLYLDRFRSFSLRRWHGFFPPASPLARGGGMIRAGCRGGCALFLAMLGGCMVGPDYRRPDPPMSQDFKETSGWKIVAPRDDLDKGAWWSIYRDPELDRLERMVKISNQNVKSFEAQYRNAVALVGEAQANLFPTIGLDAGVTRGSGGGAGGSGSSGVVSSSSSGGRSGGKGTSFSITGSASWDLDVWGRIRRQVESQVANVQASAADLANAQLSAQATLATDYFDLRAEDSLTQLLTETVAGYRRALQITQNQYRAGTAANLDVVTAQALLQSTEAQLEGVGVQRQQFEHAIAVLTGHPPADLTIAPALLAGTVPVVPPGLPATLLERRPDIAAAERQMKAENALIGVAIAAYYPDISLSALGGFVGSPLSQLFNASNRVWSLGAAASETLFDGGARSAAVAASRATYDQSVASYRQTVLTAFQQTEDALSNLRILERQAGAEASAVASAQRAVDVTLNAYRAGTVAYTSVITEQAQLLSDQQAALAIRQNRLVASVALVEALGGGWSASDLPGPDQIRAVHSPLP